MALDEFSPGRVGHLLAAARFDDLAWDRRVALAMDSARFRPRNRVTVRHLVAMPFGAQMPSRVAGRREGEMFFYFAQQSHHPTRSLSNHFPQAAGISIK